MVDLAGFREKLREKFKNGATAIVYSPGKAFFARFDGRDLQVLDANTDQVAAAYEIRVFDRDRELRWLSDGSFAEISDAVCRNCPKIDQTYLLWGEMAETVNDWTAFGDAQIGKFWVPVKASKRLALEAVEYIETDQVYGNCFVSSERFTGFREVE